MRNSNGCRVIFLLAPVVFLLFPAAVLVFVLERISKSLLIQHTYRNSRSGAYMITLSVPNSTDSTTSTDTDVTIRIDRAPTLAILGVCVAAYAVSAIDACGIWELKKVESTSGHQRTWAWVAAISNLIMAAISPSLLVFVSLCILVRQRGGFRWLCGGKGRYAGFDNVFELQQGGTPAPHIQALPQWAPQPFYVLQPAQQWQPQPGHPGQKANVILD